MGSTEGNTNDNTQRTSQKVEVTASSEPSQAQLDSELFSPKRNATSLVGNDLSSGDSAPDSEVYTPSKPSKAGIPVSGGVDQTATPGKDARLNQEVTPRAGVQQVLQPANRGDQTTASDNGAQRKVVTTAGEQPRVNQPVAQATDIAPAKVPTEVKPSGDTPVVKPAGDVTGGTRSVSGATDQATLQTKPAGTIPGSPDQVRGDVTAPKNEVAGAKVEATGARVETPGAKLDVPAATTAGSLVATTKPDGGVANVPKLDGPVGGAQTIKPNLDAPVSAAGTVIGQKQESATRPALADGGQSLPGGQVRPDGIKGDYISTQAFTGPAGRQDATRGLDTNPAQAKLNEPAALKDPKLSGSSEAGGQRTEAGLRGEQAGLRGDQAGLQPGGIKQDSKNPDSMIRSIEGKVDGAKQPAGTERRVPGAENVNPGVKQPGTADSATAGRSPSIDGGGKPQGTADGIGTKSTAGADGTSSAGRQPGQEIGGKGSGGGSATVAGESTKRIDIGGPSGGRSDGQPGGAGMGGGSSAPIDRAPHKPFGVEEAQGAGSKGIAAETKGITSDAKGITADAKGGTASQGVAPRFDTGETRGTELGQRFDTPELRGGKSGAAGGGGTGSEFGGAKGTDVGIGKGADAMGGKGGAGGGTGFSGSGESSILGDKRQPPIIPDGVVTQAGKGGKGLDGIVGGPRGDDSVPFILPGALGGKEGGRRQSDQIFADKTKGETPPAKPDAQRPDGFTAQKFAGQKPDSSSSSGSGVPGWKDGDRGQKADVGIPAAIPGQAAAEMGGALKNFAQNVLSEGKDKGVKAAESTGIRAGDSAGAKAGDVKDTKGSPKSPITDGGKGPITGGRQDFAGPGQKTRFLDAEQKNPGDQFVASRAVGPGGSGVTADKKFHGSGEGATPGMDGGDEPKHEDEVIPIEEFELPQVDLLAEAEEVEEVSEEFEKTTEAKLEDEMHYELALGLQLYTSIAQAPYGAYHYHTKDGDTVETVARDIVGDVRTAPLVFSLNKDHIIASTEYGTHPFKSGVMIQLPTPRDLKDFFGQQQ
jgi:hypothetical protein